jgi:hypothetical protein
MGGVLEGIDTAGAHLATDVGLSSGFRRRFFRTSDTERLTLTLLAFYTSPRPSSLSLWAGKEDSMFGTKSGKSGLMGLPLTIALVFFTVATPATQAEMDSGAHESDAAITIVGAWFSTVTPTVIPPFVGLGTFTADGGMVNTTSLSLGTPLESPGHGRWVRTGRRTYDVTFFTVTADAAGNHILTSKVRAKLRLSADGNEFTGVFQVDVFDPNGGLLASDTGAIRSRRIEVEPLP